MLITSSWGSTIWAFTPQFLTRTIQSKSWIEISVWSQCVYLSKQFLSLNIVSEASFTRQLFKCSYKKLEHKKIKKKTKAENFTLTLRSRLRLHISHCSRRSLKHIHVLSVTVVKVNLSSFSECSDISSWIKFSTKWGFGMVQFSFMACRGKAVNVEIPVCQDKSSALSTYLCRLGFAKNHYTPGSATDQCLTLTVREPFE